MNIKLENNVLTIGYMDIVLLEGTPVAYTRCTGTVFYLNSVISLDEIKSYYPDTKESNFKPISQESLDKGLIPMLLAELTIYNLHKLDAHIWSSL